MTRIPSDAEHVWNRACCMPERDDLRDGDRALIDSICLHGSIANGGVYCALLHKTPKDVAQGIRGLRFFDMNPVADLLATLPVGQDWPEELEDLTESRYEELDVDDLLYSQFERKFQQDPDAFAPLLPKDREVDTWNPLDQA